MRAAIRADWQRYAEDTIRDGNPPTMRRTLTQVGLQASIVYRFGRWLVGRDVLSSIALAPAWLLYAMCALWIRAAYDIRLELTAQIGPGLYIGHFGGIRLSKCTLGPGCSIAQQSQIVADDSGTGPRIGADVWLGAHIVLRGPIVVGEGAMLAAGSRAVFDVPAGALILGSPARRLSRNLRSSRGPFELGEG